MRSALLPLVALLASGCAMFSSDEEPVAPPAELVDYEARLDIDRLWVVSLGGAGEELLLGLAPATDGTRAYAGAHDGTAMAVDLGSGRRAWSVDTKLELSAGPGVGEGIVVFGTSDGDVIALDASDGSERWHAQVSSEVLAGPVVGPGSVVVRTVDGRLRVLALADGKPRWTVEQQVPRLSLRGNAAPAIAGDLVVAGFDNGRIAAYELDDGDVRWETVVAPARGRTEIERLADVDAAIQVVGQDVYTVGYHGRVVALTLSQGRSLWTEDVSGYRDLGVDWTQVYVTDEASSVIALSRGGGAVAWRNDRLAHRSLSAPVPYGQSVVVGDFEGYIHWLDATTGEIVGRTRVDDSPINCRPAVAGDVLLVQTVSGRLAAYRAGSPESG